MSRSRIDTTPGHGPRKSLRTVRNLGAPTNGKVVIRCPVCDKALTAEKYDPIALAAYQSDAKNLPKPTCLNCTDTEKALEYLRNWKARRNESCMLGRNSVGRVDPTTGRVKPDEAEAEFLKRRFQPRRP